MGSLHHCLITFVGALLLCVGGFGAAQAQPGMASQEPDMASQEPDMASQEPDPPASFRLLGFGPGMLLIPARPELGREAVLDLGGGAITSRTVRRMSAHAGWEAIVGVVLHDEDTLGSVWDWYNEGEDSEAKWVGLGLGWALIPLAASSLQAGGGAFLQSSQEAPFVHASFGLMFTPMLWRLSQPGMRFDIGSGVYGGAGVMLSDRVGVSARLSYDTLLFHELARRGYSHVWTGVATLDFRVGKKQR